MTEGNEVSGQQAAQPAPASEGAQPAGSTLSADMIQQVVEQTVDRALSSYEKRQQSQRDKLESRINKRLTEYETTYRSVSGQDLTPEQRSQLRSRAAEEVAVEIREMEKQEQPLPKTEAQPARKQEAINPVEKLILKKFEKAGITIEDGDPELVDLKDIDPYDLDELKIKIDTAIEKKKARLQDKPSNLNPDAAARVSAASVTGTPSNLKEQYRAELEKNRGDVDAIYQIKVKYRKLGLEV